MRYSCIGLIFIGLLAWAALDGADAQDRGQRRRANPDQVRHVVLFKFKEDSSEEDVQRIAEAFAELPNQIDEIRQFEWGTNSSPEGLNAGFTHCFLVSFDNAEDRDVYLDHEAHQEFVKLLGPHLAQPLVVDYVPKSRYFRRRIRQQ